MRVFVCEFVTAGGLRDKPLPEDLLPEGTLMRDAILADVTAIPGLHPVLVQDDRLPPTQLPAEPVAEGDDPWAVWARVCADSHVVWPIAPETDGLLGRMVEMAAARGARVIGCTPEAIAIASSKLKTATRLKAHGLPAIPTFPAAAPSALTGRRLTKPDQGAGAVETRVWEPDAPLPTDAGLVVQPFLDGTPASLTVLCRPDETRMLAANLQHVAVKDGRLSLTGLTVGGVSDVDGRLAALAEAVVAAFPGLSGIIGIDILLTETGPVVVEVNPRVTTAYAGLHASIGVNPAAFLPELIRDGVPPSLPHLPKAQPVEVRVR
ncbi:ATP-grasp domain-containing protein [Aquabacter sp. L1I39]|uniref:ATP-grasp domain-containing protein n=1 Tax=Aquabacter sp. L1I39 TaxID=2820278 RepID=UPI001ADA464C|nr:ATP-grasp domain-containing protein [Aquabacter sp. L1I39]QTL03700.1 ATP-grasp domain-containing protein [Aquabacter sp. L1I39]